MGRVKNFVRNYVYHPKTSRLETYLLGIIDGTVITGIASSSKYQEPLTAGGITFLLMGVILSHYIISKSTRDKYGYARGEEEKNSGQETNGLEGKVEP